MQRPSGELRKAPVADTWRVKALAGKALAAKGEAVRGWKELNHGGPWSYVCECGPDPGDDGQPLMGFELEVTWPDSWFRNSILWPEWSKG